MYQENNTQTDTQGDTQNNTPETQEQQTSNTQVTTNNNDKNIKNDNNKYEPVAVTHTFESDQRPENSFKVKKLKNIHH